jgi:hypothetical protein
MRGPILGQKTPLNVAAPGALFDLSASPGETNNVAAAHPEIVKEFSAKLAQIQNPGRIPPLPESSAAP